ncbi:hypothetical protein SMICM304S_11532 [Streptomyces microflavus]
MTEAYRVGDELPPLQIPVTRTLIVAVLSPPATTRTCTTTPNWPGRRAHPTSS